MIPLLALQTADMPHGVGLEWMPLMSFVVPAILLLLILVLGSKNTV